MALHCIENCKKKKGEQIMCCVCAKWLHAACVNLSAEEKDGVWPCFTCRQLPEKICGIEENLNKLMDMTKLILDKIDDLNHLQDSENSIKADILTVKTDCKKTPLIANWTKIPDSR